MRRPLLSVFLLAVPTSAACGASQSPPDGTTTTNVAAPDASAPAKHHHKHALPIGGPASGSPPTTLEGAVHLQVEPFADKCYDERAEADPRIRGGSVNIRLVVPATGPVQASDLGSTLADKATIDCIIGAFSRLTWRPTDGKEVDSTVPFSFVKVSD